MRQIRIGNDIQVSWEVLTSGERVSLEGRTLRLYVRSAYQKQEIETFAVEGCVVNFTYPAVMQKSTGARAVVLEDATEGAARKTICADQAFTLVAHSCEEDTDDNVEFEDYMVSLKSNILVGRPGMSAYEVWLSEGNEGTLEDWYAFLQKPAKDIAVDVAEAEAQRQEAESARVEAEAGRADAEQKRDEAEAERGNGEELRQSNEQKRVEAETKRKAVFDEMKDKAITDVLVDGNSVVTERVAKIDLKGKADLVNGSVPLSQLGNIDTQIVLVVDALPTTDIKANKIYLVKNNASGDEQNVYTEYVYLNAKWEKLGEYKAEVDLSEYAKTKDVNTVLETKADKENTIIEYKRLTETEGRLWTEEDDGAYDDFEQYLISKGNYCGFYVIVNPNQLSKFFGSTLIDFGDGRTRMGIKLYNVNDVTKCELSIDRYVWFFPKPSSNFSIVIAVANYVDKEYDPGYLSIYVNGEEITTESLIDNWELRNVSSIGASNPYVVVEAGFCAFTNTDNYRIKYADGRYELVNSNKNVVIGGEDLLNTNWHQEGFYEDGRKYVTGGKLSVNGTTTVRDLKTRSITADGTVRVNGELNVEQSIRTEKTLKAGETTINGTLHCNKLIETKSLYPANTGSSVLKDPSKGNVEGNYVVNSGNLGKPAHNYDKLFVENIYWSDCTELDNDNTSLNGVGTIPIYKIKGMDGNPTLYLSNYNCESDDRTGTGITFDRSTQTFRFVSANTDSDDDLRYLIDFGITPNGIIRSGNGNVFGDGKMYNSWNKIPADFVDMSGKADKSYVDKQLETKVAQNDLKDYWKGDVIEYNCNGEITDEDWGKFYAHNKVKKNGGFSIKEYWDDYSAYDTTLSIDSNGLICSVLNGDKITRPSVTVLNCDGGFIDLDNVYCKQKNYYTQIEVKQLLTSKADLVNGKLKESQMPDISAALGSKADVVYNGDDDYSEHYLFSPYSNSYARAPKFGYVNASAIIYGKADAGDDELASGEPYIFIGNTTGDKIYTKIQGGYVTINTGLGGNTLELNGGGIVLYNGIGNNKTIMGDAIFTTDGGFVDLSEVLNRKIPCVEPATQNDNIIDKFNELLDVLKENGFMEDA